MLDGDNWLTDVPDAAQEELKSEVRIVNPSENARYLLGDRIVSTEIKLAKHNR